MNSDDFLSVPWLDGSLYYRGESKQKIETISVVLLSLATQWRNAQIETVPIEYRADSYRDEAMLSQR